MSCRQRLVATVVLCQPAVGVIHVRLAGELDLLTITRPRRILTAALDAVATETARRTPRDERDDAGPGRVLCDLARLTFIAMCGVGMLVEAAQHARERGVGFDLHAPSPPVRRALDLVGLGGRLGETPPRIVSRPVAGDLEVAS